MSFIYIIEQINAKKVVDRTKRDYDLNWLIEILNNLEKIPSKLKPGVKRILDMLRVIIGKLRELLKKDGKLDIPGDIEKELIDVFRIVDNVDDSNFPVDALAEDALGAIKENCISAGYICERRDGEDEQPGSQLGRTHS